ncbi:MAG: ribonuclease HII [Patescibacteria group bacterium]
MKKRITIGIDEVGRGALAGPVVLAAVLCRRRIRWVHPKLGRIRDSKKLTPRRREIWSHYLRNHAVLEWWIARVSPQVIDRINIARAADRGAHRLVNRIRPRNPFWVWLDGGLRLPAHIPHRSVTRGDELIPLIAAASIIAKVWRDRMMTRLDRAFPAYGFSIHKGYGTRFHQRMIRRHGPSAIHRRSFIT